MKPNEIIGYSGLITCLFSPWLFVFDIVSGWVVVPLALIGLFIQIIFLSWWGLETFNSYFNRK